MRKKGLGDHGERIAVQYLKQKGFRIVKQQFRSPFGEVDILATKEACTHIVEVKTRSSVSFGSAAESLSKKQLSRLCKVARWWNGKRKSSADISIDLLAVDISEYGEVNITHLENITL